MDMECIIFNNILDKHQQNYIIEKIENKTKQKSDKQVFEFNFNLHIWRAILKQISQIDIDKLCYEYI